MGHPSKFQLVSRLAFITAATSLTGGQPNFAQCLAISWAATLCIHFRGPCPLTELCPMQNSLYVQVLRSHILSELLHVTPAMGVSHTLRHGTRNGITELSQRVPPIFGRAAITLGIGPHFWFSSSLLCFPLFIKYITTVYLWPPYVIGGPLYFCPVVSFFFFLLSSFFSSPNLSGRRLDVYHTSTHGVALVRI